jgi:hypothetical protein
LQSKTPQYKPWQQINHARPALQTKKTDGNATMAMGRNKTMAQQ